ncbi:putative serine/threonine-protein kinase tsuA-like protein [Dinothrombium tinctorium]|uniref:Putative serine/threonine-protein kinase tsuA-like protein n=1 Tax=Dinothrombium tinctorium TaxID=1965070 RepID=A0A443RPW0_9ACAR|nr:putative serine/threonine-protein kinase tsuA-like protein [Dinothrombium tinctorium]
MFFAVLFLLVSQTDSAVVNVVHFPAFSVLDTNSESDENDGTFGKAGEDYPAFHEVPETKFTCEQLMSGYYADIESGCQSFHYCFRETKTSFLCQNGTLFNQKVFTCDWWFNVDCKRSTQFYALNKFLYKVPDLKALNYVKRIAARIPQINEDWSENDDENSTGGYENEETIRS